MNLGVVAKQFIPPTTINHDTLSVVGLRIFINLTTLHNPFSVLFVGPISWYI